MPGRPQSLTETGIDLKRCHVATVANATELYRLCDYGREASGVFHGGNLVCENIPIKDEKSHFVGLLLFNKNAFEKAKSDCRHYWEWRNNLNDARWQNQESGELDYDAKNMIHTFRLLYSGLNIMKHGEPLVRFTGDARKKLLEIRSGKFAHDDLMRKVETLSEELKLSLKKSNLPEVADLDAVNRLLLDITKQCELDNLRQK